MLHRHLIDEGAADVTLRFGFVYGDPDPVTGIRVHSETNALGHITRYHVDERAQIVAGQLPGIPASQPPPTG